jgi:hypothetical protein
VGQREWLTILLVTVGLYLGYIILTHQAIVCPSAHPPVDSDRGWSDCFTLVLALDSC